MDFTEFEADENDDGRRLEKVAKRLLESKNAKDTNVYSLLRKNLIKMNNKKAKAETKVSTGDKIQVANFLLGQVQNEIVKEKDTSSANDHSIEIILKTPHLLFINKSAGINVQPSKKEELCLSKIVADLFEREGKSSSLSFRPGPVHRIDKGTSGIVAFSQSLAGAKWFAENIENHSIGKTYLAVVEGTFDPKSELHYEDWILNDGKTNVGFQTVKVFSSKENDESRKFASSFVEPLAEGTLNGKKLSLVKVRIETGRKHQIRAQMSFHSHPLFGDTAYGGSSNPHGSFFLHAWKMNLPASSFDLPSEIEAPLPQKFSEFLESILINVSAAL